MTIGQDLQKLLLDTLKANAGVMALVNGVWDNPPADTVRWATPKAAYISFGATDINDDYAECIDGETHTIQVDIWSRTVGTVGCKQIVDVVRKLLKRAPLQLNENALVEINIPLTRVFKDPDGLTTHGVLQVEIMVEIA